MFLLLLTLTLHCCCNCNATVAPEGDRDESTRCIGKFSELNSYILNNEELLNNLTEAFYPAGEVPSTFVTIDYYYSEINDNRSNSATDRYVKYFWSEKVLYLMFFCPRAIKWLTLFAIQVSESSVTVELPCLCSSMSNRLLSRLTYQIKVYAAMEIAKNYNQNLNFLNRHYIELELENLSYCAVIISWTVLQIAMFFVFRYLRYAIIYPRVYTLTEIFVNRSVDIINQLPKMKPSASDRVDQQENGNASNCNTDTVIPLEEITPSSPANNYVNTQVNGNARKSEIHSADNHTGRGTPCNFKVVLISLLLFNILLLMGLIALKCMIFKIIFYDNKLGGCIGRILCKGFLIFHTVATVGIVCLVIPEKLTMKLLKGCFNIFCCHCAYGKYTVPSCLCKSEVVISKDCMAKFITVNITLAGCYFLPCMILAIIYEPLQALFIYSSEIILIASLYFLLLSLCLFVYIIRDYWLQWSTCSNSKAKSICCFPFKACGYCLNLLGVALSFVVSFVIIILIIIVGGLSDFETLIEQEKALLLGIIALSILKLLYNKVNLASDFRSQNEIDNNNTGANTKLQSRHSI